MNNLREMFTLVDETKAMAKQVVELANKVIENQRRINEYFELEDELLKLNIQISNTNNTVDSNINSSEQQITEQYVSEFITQLGIPSHIKGYRYIISALLLVVDDFDIINSVTKKLYPEVAKEYKTTASRVERAIRHAIEVAWSRGNVDILNDLFGYTIDADKGKPTNSEFLARIATKLSYIN